MEKIRELERCDSKNYAGVGTMVRCWGRSARNIEPVLVYIPRIPSAVPPHNSSTLRVPLHTMVATSSRRRRHVPNLEPELWLEIFRYATASPILAEISDYGYRPFDAVLWEERNWFEHEVSLFTKRSICTYATHCDSVHVNRH